MVLKLIFDCLMSYDNVDDYNYLGFSRAVAEKEMGENINNKRGTKRQLNRDGDHKVGSYEKNGKLIYNSSTMGKDKAIDSLTSSGYPLAKTNAVIHDTDVDLNDDDDDTGVVQVLLVPTHRVKLVKSYLESMNWLDKSHRISPLSVLQSEVHYSVPIGSIGVEGLLLTMEDFIIYDKEQEEQRAKLKKGGKEKKKRNVDSTEIVHNDATSNGGVGKLECGINKVDTGIKADILKGNNESGSGFKGVNTEVMAIPIIPLLAHYIEKTLSLHNDSSSISNQLLPPDDLNKVPGKVVSPTLMDLRQLILCVGFSHQEVGEVEMKEDDERKVEMEGRGEIILTIGRQCNVLNKTVQSSGAVKVGNFFDREVLSSRFSYDSYYLFDYIFTLGNPLPGILRKVSLTQVAVD